MEKAKLGITRFFTGYFKNFHKILFTNILFAVPLGVFCLVFYLLNTLTGVNSSLISFLPLIFVFPFFSGVTLITRNIVREEKSIPVFKLFIKGFADNFKYFLVHGILLYCAVFLCYSSIGLYWSLGKTNGLFYVPFCVAAVITVFLLFVFYNIPVMTVTFDLSLKNIYKNCALMSFGELKNNFFATLGLFLLFIFSATVYIAAPNETVLIVIMLIVSVLIVPSTASYIMNFYVYRDIEAVILNGGEKSEELQQKINDARSKGSSSKEKKQRLDFSSLDLDESKDGDEYLYFNGKMIKRRVLIDMKNKQESADE